MFLAVSVFSQAAPESGPAEVPVETPAGEAPDFELVQNRGGGVTITAYRGNSRNVAIPAKIGGRQVTVIGPRSFYARELESVDIPEGVQTIGYCAFAGNQLSSLTLPQSLKAIEYEAFQGNRISALVLPEGLVSLGVRSFAGNRLDSLSVSRRLTFIGQGAFAGNSFTEIAMAEGRNLFTSQGFDQSFVNYYLSTGKKAGIYIRDGRVWSIAGE
ncbi:MAG: leucine-rich repeat domain-containing protein [Treponema sp.]|nr:leucine-rich repeat domain-containing protein [Treponema sp.]